MDWTRAANGYQFPPTSCTDVGTGGKNAREEDLQKHGVGQ